MSAAKGTPMTPAQASALTLAYERIAEIRESRIEEYLFIGGGRMSARAAAGRLGVNERTVTRWRRDLRERQARP